MDWVKNLRDEEESNPPRIPEPANPDELRIMAQLLDILIYCCKTKTNYPCADGKGIKEYEEMKESLLSLADDLERRGAGGY